MVRPPGPQRRPCGRRLTTLHAASMIVARRRNGQRFSGGFSTHGAYPVPKPVCRPAPAREPTGAEGPLVPGIAPEPLAGKGWLDGNLPQVFTRGARYPWWPAIGPLFDDVGRGGWASAGPRVPVPNVLPGRATGAGHVACGCADRGGAGPYAGLTGGPSSFWSPVPRTMGAWGPGPLWDWRF